MINLLEIEPVKASTDLSSYTSFIYGVPKVGKTTFVHDLYGEKVLFVATEKRHKVLVGAHVQYVSSWSDYVTILNQLRNPKLKERYDVICIDTVENLYEMLEKYILSQFGITEFGQAEWGKDWRKLKQSWKDGLTQIEKMGYTPVFVSHATQNTVKIPIEDIHESEINEGTMELVKGKEGEQYYEFLKYTPDLKDKIMAPINKMVDNILFMNISVDEKTMRERRIIHLRETLQWQAGSTFEGIKPTIKLSAEAYKKAVEDAIGLIDKKHLKDEKESTGMEENKLDFEALMKEAKQIGTKLHKANRMDEVQRIVDEIFGAGQKLTEAKPYQVEPLNIAVQQLRDLMEEEK